MLIGSRQDAHRYATGACPLACSLEGTGFIDFGPTRVFESMILATSSDILLESGGGGVARGRVNSGNNDETTSANACRGS